MRAWVAKGRRFALGFTGGTPSDRFFAELSARYSGDGALAFVQIDASEDCARWRERLAGIPIKTADDGEQQRNGMEERTHLDKDTNLFVYLWD